MNRLFKLLVIVFVLAWAAMASAAINDPMRTDPWSDLDRSLADTLSSYWANFAITGDPNGKGLPVWPAFKEKNSERDNATASLPGFPF